MYEYTFLNDDSSFYEDYRRATQEALNKLARHGWRFAGNIGHSILLERERTEAQPASTGTDDFVVSVDSRGMSHDEVAEKIGQALGRVMNEERSDDGILRVYVKRADEQRKEKED